VAWRDLATGKGRQPRALPARSCGAKLVGSRRVGVCCGDIRRRPGRFKGQIAVVDASVDVANSVIGAVMKQASVRSLPSIAEAKESVDRSQSNLPSEAASTARRK